MSRPNFSPRKTSISLLLGVLFLAAAGWPSAAQKNSRSSSAAKHALQKPIADPVVIDQQGYQEILGKYRGKPLLVNFWATWCEPCREEYPMLNELAKQYAPQGLQVVGVSLDDDGEMILVRRFLARHQPIFPNFRKRPGKEEQFINAIYPKWTGAIPASFFYARDGRLIGQILGESTRDAYEAAIRALLASGAKDSPGTPSGSGLSKK
ncbi:MAG TPA: redoxin domain-containing protein [Candidatus Acidoferrales bacterium]|nr:redoxin domain-containing protein [Candidatus Acidoferrales bacterium]